MEKSKLKDDFSGGVNGEATHNENKPLDCSKKYEELSCFKLIYEWRHCTSKSRSCTIIGLLYDQTC